MRLQTRKRIFYVFLLLFVVIGVAVVLYAEGWRIDPTTLQARKAGGIYVRSFPESAAITLNGAAIKNQSGFLSPGTFISGLFPKTYTLALKADGYNAWTENAPVFPSLVTEMKYAVLVPDSAVSAATSGAVSDFFEADGDIVAEAPNGSIMWRGKAIGAGAIVSHSADLRTAIIRGTNARTGAITYSLYDFAESTSTNLSPTIRAAGMIPGSDLNIFIDPYDPTGIIVQTSAKIVRIESDTLRTTAIGTAISGETIESPIAVSPSVMAWAQPLPTTTTGAVGSSQIIVYDKFSGDVIDSSLIVPGAVKQLAWVKDNELGVLESDNSLYLYDVLSETLSKLADDVKQFYPTEDGSAIAALEYHSLEVFAFNTQGYYRFDLPQAGDVKGLIWYQDETHLFVQYPDRVSFLDLADTNLKNLTTVSEGTDAAYDPQENSLYLIDQGQKLIRFDFPQ
jgi:hypothetical protein